MTVERARPRERDFLFLDPPYDSRFSTYGTGGFNEHDHRRVFELAARVRCRTLLVTQATPLTVRLASHLCKANRAFEMTSYATRYSFSARGRHSRDATHLLLRNYHP